MLGYQPGMIIIERFELKVRLGAGAMGIVFGAVDRKLDEEVALKFLPMAMAEDREAVGQFAGEVKRARRVSGRYVLRVYDMWDDGEGGHFVTMEWAKGGDLNSYRRHRGLVPWEETKRLLVPILRGLQTVHEAGIVHRDVKPGNILFREEGIPIVADFGISKSIMASMSRISQDTSISGTPAYMAPEAIRGTDDIGPATDLYAVGSMVYEMLTGHTPFKGDPMSVMFNQTQSDPSFKDVPREAVRWIGACLVKDINGRVQNAEQLLRGLSDPSGLPVYIPMGQLAERAIHVPQPQPAAAPPSAPRSSAQEAVVPGRTYKVGAKRVKTALAAGLPEKWWKSNTVLPWVLGSTLAALVILVIVVASGVGGISGGMKVDRNESIGDQHPVTGDSDVVDKPDDRLPPKPETPTSSPSRDHIVALEQKAQRLFRNSSFRSGPDGNVWETCQEIMKEEPENSVCLELIDGMRDKYRRWIESSLAEHDCEKAARYAVSLGTIGGGGDYSGRITECRRKTSVVQAMTAKCPYCGRTTEEGKICQMCGRSLQGLTVACPNCRKWTADEKYCIHCGYELK